MLTPDEWTDKLWDMIVEHETDYCNNCPNLRYVEDIGTYDCPYGLSIDCCEFSPCEDVNKLGQKVYDVIQVNKP